MTVLVIVPTLGRRPDFLGRCLRSIARQGRDDVEIVVVAPAHVDLGPVVAEVGARRVADPARGGLGGAINAGLDAAAPGVAYVGWLGDDDLLSPGSLDATVDVLEGDRGVVLAYGWCDYVDTHDAVVFRSRAGRLAGLLLGFGPNLVPQPGSLMRYDAVRAVGDVDETLRYAPDLDLFLRLRSRGRLVAVPRTLAAFRWHADSTTVAEGEQSMEEADQVRMRYMSPAVASAYDVGRWPGRWALRVAKRRATSNVARAAARA